MNILMVTAYPPVPHMHGGGVRMYHNIRILSAHHCVHVVSFYENDEEREWMRPLEAMCESVTLLRRAPGRRARWLSLDPFLVDEFASPEMHEVVDQRLALTRIDAIQCEYLQMAQYRRAGVVGILTLHEVLSSNAYETFIRERKALDKIRCYYQWMAMLRYEVRAARRFEHAVVMTREDAEYLRSYAPSAPVIDIPIGIDARRYSPRLGKPGHPPEILFVGNFRHGPNVEAVHFLGRRLIPILPDVRFVVAGSPVSPEWLNGTRADFVGHIEDQRTLYKSPDTIVVAPLFSGTGQRVKLLEAFAMAVPVVTTTVGARGFPIEHGRQALIANSDQEFARAIRQLVGSRGLRERIGANARRMILEHFTWEKIEPRLLGLLPKNA